MEVIQKVRNRGEDKFLKKPDGVKYSIENFK